MTSLHTWEPTSEEMYADEYLPPVELMDELYEDLERAAAAFLVNPTAENRAAGFMALAAFDALSLEA